MRSIGVSVWARFASRPVFAAAGSRLRLVALVPRGRFGPTQFALDDPGRARFICGKFGLA